MATFDWTILVAETLGISEGVKPYINAIQPVGSNDNTDYGPHRTDKDCPDDHEGRQSGKNIEKKWQWQSK